mgnify:CR=1 FL=1
MALFIRQDDNRSKLQERLVAELQERAKKNAGTGDIVDGVQDSRMLEDTKTTTSLAWIWVLVVLFIVAGAVWLTTVLTTA